MERNDPYGLLAGPEWRARQERLAAHARRGRGIPILGDITGANQAAAAERAAGVQAGSVREGIGALRENYGEGLNFLRELYGDVGDTYQESPGFRFALDEALTAADRGSGARRSPYGSAAERRRMGTAAGLASQDYGNWLGARMGIAGNIASLFGMQGRDLSGAFGDLGNVQASGIVGAANAQAAGTNNLLNMGGSAAALYLLGSDARLKRNIEALDGAECLALALRLRPVVWEWAQTVGTMQRLPGEPVLKAGHGSMGVIAQEVNEVLPELVHKGPDGYLRVDYGALTGILLGAVQELARAGASSAEGTADTSVLTFNGAGG